MFKLKRLNNSNSTADKIRERFNNKSFYVRAKIWIKVEIIAFYLRIFK